MSHSFEKGHSALCCLLGFGWLTYQVQIMFYPVMPLTERFVHLAFALMVFILGKSYLPNEARIRTRLPAVWDSVILVTFLGVTFYYLKAIDRLNGRMEAVDPIQALDIVFSILLLVIVLDSVRRIVGWSLISVLLFFLGFGFVGKLIPGWTQWTWLPEIFKFRGFMLQEAMEGFALTPNGLLGVTTATSVDFVFYFVMFGAVYSAIGGGQLFIDIGLKLASRSTGGAAKAAVVSSSLMGSISGSAVANVTTTGLFTIPLMRRAGNPAVYAAAVEAIASTGGQLMPPVMGVAAFVMAEFLQEPYHKVAVAGLIPALAFYLALFLTVDLRERKKNRSAKSVEANDSPILKRSHLLLPPIFLVSILIAGWSASMAAVLASLLCVVMSVLWPSLRKSWSVWQGTILQGTRQAAEVAIPIASIGLIIEVAVQSNLALKFSILLLEISGSTLIGAMIWIVLGCVIMGLGLPTVAAYIIGAILFVPAMKEMGIPELPAHFFVMYYCVMSMVTPPVALASYAAAGLAGANSFYTSLLAFRLGIVGFIIPFAFAFNPALLAQGPLVNILASALVLFLGTTVWILALEGYWYRVLSFPLRLSLGVTSLLFLLAPVLVIKIQLQTGLTLWQSRGMVWGGACCLLLISYASIRKGGIQMKALDLE